MNAVNDKSIRIRVPHENNAISGAIDELHSNGFQTTLPPEEPIVHRRDYSEWVLHITAVNRDWTMVDEILRKHGLERVPD